MYCAVQAADKADTAAKDEEFTVGCLDARRGALQRDADGETTIIPRLPYTADEHASCKSIRFHGRFPLSPGTINVSNRVPWFLTCTATVDGPSAKKEPLTGCGASCQS